MTETFMYGSLMLTDIKTREFMYEPFLQFLRDEYGHNDIGNMRYFYFYNREVGSTTNDGNSNNESII